MEAQLKRATEVLKVLKQASADADNVGTQVAAIKEKTKIQESDIRIPEFKRVDPESIEDVEEKNLEKQSPIHAELAKLAKRIMWGTKPELYKTEIEKITTYFIKLSNKLFIFNSRNYSRRRAKG